MEELKTISNNISYSPPQTTRRKILSWPVVVGTGIICFLVGFWFAKSDVVSQLNGQSQVLNKNQPIPEYLSKDVSFNLFWQVWDTLQKEYLHAPVPDTQLFYGALAGLVAGAGDPYTVFLDPKTASEFGQELSGSFEGIGAEIGMRDGGLVIIAPLEGTPADKAGVLAGGVLLNIDGIDTYGMTVEDAVTRIRGKRGTVVSLGLYRPKTEEKLTINVGRDTIIVKSVRQEIKETSSDVKIPYIRITNFNEDTATQFQAIVDKAIQSNPKGIIIDVRNNPGGFLDVAVDIAGYWIDNNVVVKESGKENIEHKSSGVPMLKDIKTVILVNGGSASASEILAGALQDYNKATVIGEKTFGKGTVQSLTDLPDGSAIKITVAEWLTPNGRSIEEQGIEPDVVVEDKRENDSDDILAKALEMINQ